MSPTTRPRSRSASRTSIRQGVFPLKTVLMSGSAGFIGSHTLKYILDNTDWNVVCLVTFRHKGKSDRLNVALEGQDPSRVRILFHDLQGPISPQMDDEIGPVNYVLSIA